MRTASPRNALAFLGDKLQARRDAAFLEDYRKQEHASLQNQLSYNVEDDAEILAKQQKVTSVIKYNNQSPGERSSFSTSNQLLYYSPVNPSAEHGRSSNSPRRRQNDMLSQEDMATADATLSPKSFRRSRLGTTSTFDKTVGSATTRSFTATRSFNATPANADRAIDRNLSLSATARFIAATSPAAENINHGTYGNQTTASVSFGGTAITDDAAVCSGVGVSGKGGKGKRLSELLQNPEPATPRRHGGATVRFSDEPTDHPDNKTDGPSLNKSYGQHSPPSAQHVPSSKWRANFLTASSSPVSPSTGSTARTESSSGSASSQRFTSVAVLHDESFSDCSLSTGSESDPDSIDETDSCSEASSEAASTSDTADTAGTAGIAARPHSNWSDNVPATALSAGLQTPLYAIPVALISSKALNSSPARVAVVRASNTGQPATEQVRESLADRCLRPLSKLQQADFLPAGAQRSVNSRQATQTSAGLSSAERKKGNSSMQASQTELVWQGSGWGVPFDPALVHRPGQAVNSAAPPQQPAKLTTSLSWHATSLDSKETTGTAGTVGAASLTNPAGSAGTAGAANSNNAAGSASSAGIADSSSVASSDHVAISARTDQPVSVSDLPIVAGQPLQEAALPIQSSISPVQQQSMQQPAETQLTDQSQQSKGGPAEQSTKHRGLGRTSTKGKKHSRHDALAHVEDHLQILKHVHLKKASPRTLLQNRERAEQLGFSALPETLEGYQPAAASALRPVMGQDTWYRVGMHVLPEELNAAVLEALAAEAAGLPSFRAQTGPPRPNTSPSASWLMRMESEVKVMVYDDKLDGPAAGKQRIPAINPNRAYLKSLARGSAKKHFQSVEVDLRESHRRLLATQAALQPVTYSHRRSSIST